MQVCLCRRSCRSDSHKQVQQELTTRFISALGNEFPDNRPEINIQYATATSPASQEYNAVQGYVIETERSVARQVAKVFETMGPGMRDQCPATYDYKFEVILDVNNYTPNQIKQKFDAQREFYENRIQFALEYSP